MSFRCISTSAGLPLALVMAAGSARAQTTTRGETYAITRGKVPIVIDANLSDEGWRDALRIETWYAVDPADNIEPIVHSVGYLTYDHKYLYVGFELDDPNPKAIVAPFGDHDNLDRKSVM